MKSTKHQYNSSSHPSLFIISVMTICVIFTMQILPIEVNAQNVKSGYFFEKIPGRNLMNAAFSNDFNYIGLPGLTSIDFKANTNGISADKLFFPHGNEVVTLLHPSVSADKVANLKENNRIGVGLNHTVAGFGIRHKNESYTSFSISHKTESNTFLPKSLFELAKKLETNTYNLAGSRTNSYSYIDLAIGHSRKINENLRIGANLHVLGGLSHVNMQYDRFYAELQDNLWRVYANGTVNSSFLGLENRSTVGSNIEDYFKGWTDQTINFKGFTGYGFAADFGAEWRPYKSAKLSFAANNLGILSWSASKSAKGEVATIFVFSGFQFDTDNGDSFDDQIDSLKKDLKTLYNMKRVAGGESMTTKLAPEFLLGFEQEIANGKISFGALLSSKIYKDLADISLMLSSNFKPCSWFYSGLNFSIPANEGIAAGGIIGFSPKGFNFYIAADYIPFEYSKQMIPIKASALNFRTGISITFGHLKKK